MINTNREMTYVNMYLLEKEVHLTDNVRNALNKIYYYMSKKGNNKAEAIHKTHLYYKHKKNVILESRFLWKQYNSRQAHIKNGKVKFQEWAKEIRELSLGIINELPFCACGCGERVTKKGNKYINGHNLRCLTQEQKDENARHMREIKSLKNRKDNVHYLDTKICKIGK